MKRGFSAAILKYVKVHAFAVHRNFGDVQPILFQERENIAVAGGLHRDRSFWPCSHSKYKVKRMLRPVRYYNLFTCHGDTVRSHPNGDRLSKRFIPLRIPIAKKRKSLIPEDSSQRRAEPFGGKKARIHLDELKGDALQVRSVLTANIPGKKKAVHLFGGGRCDSRPVDRAQRFPIARLRYPNTAANHRSRPPPEFDIPERPKRLVG